MSSIDERVVEMKFNNGQFQNGVKSTMDSLSALKKGLQLQGAQKGLQDVDAAAKKLSFAGLAEGVEGISKKFIALSTIAITALSNITTKLMQMGSQFLKTFTVDPIRDGLREYETKLNSIQTIIANTQSKGETMSTVTAALQELNTYSDKTIYNFAEMARNIGTFTAAGVGLDTSVQAIKGIANLAAISGSSSAQASTAMYQLSQALATGTVKLMDWNSVVNAGMGGEVFQEALKTTARVHGVAVDAIIAKEGSFRDSLQTGWLSAEILTETLSQFTGEMTAEQLKQMGYTDQQIEGILEMAKTAVSAATEVKTFSQLIGTLQETAGSGWAQTWEIIFGNLDEAKVLWTDINNIFSDMINSSAEARNNVLQGWKDLGGRDVAIEAVKNLLEAIQSLIKPIKEAFRTFFPPATAQQLFDITVAIRDFTSKLILSSETAEQVKRIFSGIFAVFDLVRKVIMGVIGVFGGLAGEMSGAGGGLLEFAARIGDWLVKANEAITAGDGLTKFFDGISNVLSRVIGWVRQAVQWFGSLFETFGSAAADNAGNAVGALAERLDPLQRLGAILSGAWNGTLAVLRKVYEFVAPFVSRLAEAFAPIGERLAEAFSNMDYGAVLDTLNTGLFAALVLAIKKFLDGGINISPDGGLIGSIKETLEGVTGTLSAMQQQLKAGTLLKIAGAIALLTVSVVALSLIDSAALTKALTALTVMFTQLFVGLMLFDKAVKTSNPAKLAAIGAALILLSIAILILTAAVRNLSGLSWEELAKGLVGVMGLLGLIVGFVKAIGDSAPKLILTGLGMIAIAIAVRILANAVSAFAAMDWATMGKGLAGVGATLAALAIFEKLTKANKMGIVNGAGLILLAVSLKLLAGVVSQFGGMDWDAMGRGFAGMGASLLIIALAMRAMPKNMIVNAVSLIIVAGALLLIGQVIQNLGGMSWEQIAKGLVTLAGALIVIGIAVALMQGAIMGAIAIGIVAVSLALLGTVLVMFGNMSWESIGKGLAMLAGVLILLALAGALMTPLIPTLLGLGIAVALLGVGMMAAGLGMLAFATGLALLVAVGGAGAAVLVAIVAGLISLIPLAFAAVAEGIKQFARIIGESGPEFVAAMTAVLMALITTIETVTPEIIDMFMNIILKLLESLAVNVPKFVDAGMRILIGFLNGIGRNIGKVVDAATNIIVNFLNGIARNIPKIATAATNVIIAFVRAIGDNAARIAAAGADTLIKFVNSLSKTIETRSEEMRAAGGRLATAILNGLTGGIFGGVGRVIGAVTNMASNAINAAKRALGIASPSKVFKELGLYTGEGYVQGVDASGRMVSKSVDNLGTTAVNTMRDALSKMAEVAGQNIDLAPTIKPVLDLSDVQKTANKIDGVLGTHTIKTAVGYSQAAAASDAYQTLAEQKVSTSTTQITYTQNNNSPKALSTGEIYRQTRNQLSVLRGVRQ